MQTIVSAAIGRRRPADLLLLAVTATAIVLLSGQTPRFRLVDWIYVVQHLIVLEAAFTRPAAVVRDDSFSSNITVAVAYLYPYAQVICLRRWPGEPIWPEGGMILVTVAAFLSVVCLLTIGRSFGVRPALRSLVTGGAYRLVRHPVYLSYIVADIGYNLQLSNSFSMLLVLVAWASLVYRILREERVLAGDPGWPAYVASVRYRLVPALW